MSKRTPQKSPSKRPGVTWWQQAPRSFITPYGLAKDAPEASQVLNRLQPFTSEWLSRPEIAISEYADTISSNLPMLDEKPYNTFINPSILKQLNQKFGPLQHNLEAMNNKSTAPKTGKDAKKVIRSLLDDDELDEMMDTMFKVSGAMFAMATNYIIGTALVRHPKNFGKIVNGNSKMSAIFKESSTAENMKKYLLEFFDKEDDTCVVARKASASVSKAFDDSDSSDKESGSRAPKGKKKRAKVSNIEASEVQQPDNEEETVVKPRKLKRKRIDFDESEEDDKQLEQEQETAEEPKPEPKQRKNKRKTK